MFLENLWEKPKPFGYKYNGSKPRLSLTEKTCSCVSKATAAEAVVSQVLLMCIFSASGSQTLLHIGTPGEV